jgi:PilZ domain
MSLFRRREEFKDLRKSPRHDVDYLALVESAAPDGPFTCIICDISASGAKLTVGSHHEVPDEFTLVFRRRCRVIRRFDGQVGIQFVPGH